ncbi:hypothetical protein L3V59_27195 [Burkholderia aenigmatica]|uniref:hypothetical protein n=1 Tax=Burkholderia aenigmatica TaxID=2015348 RepID=UPI001F15B235|nr:hypothetical protein [Burkholderia aenigmatica]UKD16501.1 hypothetical protein L3V59_27195 [Burkholderia aenigmatica]
MRRTCRWLARKMRRSQQQHAAAGSADGFERMMLFSLARRLVKPRSLARVAAACIWLAAALPIAVLVERPAFAVSDASSPAATSSSSVESPASAASRAHAASSAHASSGASAAQSAPAASHAHPVQPASPASGASSASSASGASASAASAASASAASAATPASAASTTPASEVGPPAPTPARRHPLLSADDAKNATARAVDMRKRFTQEVTRRLNVPASEQRAYGERLQKALVDADLGDLAGEYIAMVDRAPTVQALFIYFRATPANAWMMIGASPVGTGLPGKYDHFLTPLGVFHHSPDNMDFRAEGTTNENGIRGYGRRDMRIYDFGWVDGERGWGKGGVSPMRFQMHATDPDRLESLLGIRHSKGCVRIPASLNTFFDRHGLLDDDYQARVEAGKSLWVLRRDRDITPIAGRYLVVIDSARKTRPAWSPLPGRKAWSKVPKGGDTAD